MAKKCFYCNFVKCRCDYDDVCELCNEVICLCTKSKKRKIEKLARCDRCFDCDCMKIIENLIVCHRNHECVEPIWRCNRCLKSKKEKENEIIEQEQQEQLLNEQISDNDDLGVCCFCGWECNPLSQACGSCTRNGLMFMSGAV